jgi:peptide-methionine (S)-S-oxide reductase
MIETEQATLAGGCFWCLEAAYLEIEGVIDVVNGYSGGQRVNPTYEQVCSGATGHAETVQITFEPKIIKYADILDIFFSIHNPTTLNRQGYDVGTEYRSIVFYHNHDQKITAEQALTTIAPLWNEPVVTELVPLVAFYPAEAYHQRYFAKNPTQAYCQAIINPKLVHLRENFRSRLKP